MAREICGSLVMMEGGHATYVKQNPAYVEKQLEIGRALTDGDHHDFIEIQLDPLDESKGSLHVDPCKVVAVVTAP